MFPYLLNQIVYYVISEALFQFCDSKSNKNKGLVAECYEKLKALHILSH